MAENLVEPRVEGNVALPDGRRLGFVEFGPARGRVVFWFHGTPGARRQIPHAARIAAHRDGVVRIGFGRRNPLHRQQVRPLAARLKGAGRPRSPRRQPGPGCPAIARAVLNRLHASPDRVQGPAREWTGA